MPGTRDTRAHTGTRIAQTPQPSKPTNTPARPRDDRIRGRLNSETEQFCSTAAAQEPNAPKTLPAADSEEAAPSEPDQVNPTRPPPAPRAPPRTCSLLDSLLPCSKAVGETVLSVPLDSTPFAVLNTNNATETRPWP